MWLVQAPSGAETRARFGMTGGAKYCEAYNTKVGLELISQKLQNKCWVTLWIASNGLVYNTDHSSTIDIEEEALGPR